MTLQLGGVSIDRLLVVGFGVTGRAVCRYAARHGTSAFLSERRELSGEERSWLVERGIEHEEGAHTDQALNGADAVVLSPSVPLNVPLVVEAKRRGTPVYSELDLAVLSGALRPIVAVTGTNGKSSTVALIGELLRLRGRKAPVVGNIGHPVIDVVDEAGRHDATVIEASSYQLEQSVAFRPDVGVLLNLEPDHLARHGTMDAYAEAKGRLFRLQAPSDVAILPGGLRERFPQGVGRRVFYEDDCLALPDRADRLPPHQRANLRAALCACKALLPGLDWRRLPIERVVAALRLPHRLEEVGIFGGVRAVDDSKATNPASTIAALDAVDEPVVLLLGGRSKGAGYEDLRDAIDGSSIRRIILFGESAESLSTLLEGRSLDRVGGIDAAVRAGLDAARPGDTLLFSPACSSFDQYRSFEERGEAFARAVRMHVESSNS